MNKKGGKSFSTFYVYPILNDDTCDTSDTFLL